MTGVNFVLEQIWQGIKFTEIFHVMCNEHLYLLFKDGIHIHVMVKHWSSDVDFGIKEFS